MAPSRDGSEGEADFASLLSPASGGHRQDQGQKEGASQNKEHVSVPGREGSGSNSEDAGTLGEDLALTPFAKRPSRLPQPSGVEIEAELAALSRGPFRRILTDFLGFAPSANALRRFAEKNPDKWANALGIIAQLAGYHKELKVEGTINHVHAMSDSDIERRRKELLALEAAQNRTIIPQPREQEAARKMTLDRSERAPAPKMYQELAPSRDDTIIDVQTKEIK